jgi:transposase-like protein
MINWELPHENVACPHCGSTETQLSLELLGLIRYSCNSCRKSFAIQGDTKPKTIASASSAPASPEASASSDASASRRA